MKLLSDSFNIKYGDRELHSKEQFNEGETLVVSSSGINNGFYNFLKFPINHIDPVISVPSTGSIGMAFVQLRPCSIDDNCLVITPKKQFNIEYLFYIITIIRTQKWRYVYGRQLTPQRIGQLRIIPFKEFMFNIRYTELKKKLAEREEKYKIHSRTLLSNIDKFFEQYDIVPITELFNICNAKSKSFAQYEYGTIPFISNGFANNGIIGYVKPMPNDKLFNASICVSTFCEATVQMNPFLPRGNGGSGLLILQPKKKMSWSDLIFHTAYINKNYSWRFSYGRMVTKDRLEKFTMLNKYIK